MKKLTGGIAIIATVLVLYVGVYATLSYNGRYVPSLGIDYVKWYFWVPKGCESQSQSVRCMMSVFLPLYKLDSSYWHTEDEVGLRRYPIAPHRTFPSPAETDDVAGP